MAVHPQNPSSTPLKPALAELAGIVAGGLCHRCGTCAAVCPAGVIEPDDESYPAWGGRTNQCTGCGLCVKACPGSEFLFPDFEQSIFGDASTAGPPGLHGRFIKAFLGYSTDAALRASSTSGGLATQLPLHLLRTGKAAGAFTVRMDEACAWRPTAFVARTEEELLQGQLSKYPACSMNHLFQEIRGLPGPFVMTGLPCQIHGYRKLAALRRKAGEQISLAIGLFCHSCLDHQALRDILAAYRVPDAALARLEFRHGKLPGIIRAQTRAGTWIGLPYPRVPIGRYRPNAKECLTMFFKLYSPPRCRMCADASAEFADISLADPWIRGWQGQPKLYQGYNLVLARTARGLRALEEAEAAGAIVLEPIADPELTLSDAPMVRKKKMRAFFNIARRGAAGLPVPEYGLTRTFSFQESCRARLHALTYFAADRPGLRLPIVRALLSPPGRWLAAAIFFRRRVWHALKERRRARRRGPTEQGELGFGSGSPKR